MISAEYRFIISKIAQNAIKKHFPGIKTKDIIENCGVEIARSVHARMYGANVDGVDSPIWQDRTKDKPEPKVDAAELLKQE